MAHHLQKKATGLGDFEPGKLGVHRYADSCSFLSKLNVLNFYGIGRLQRRLMGMSLVLLVINH